MHPLKKKRKELGYTQTEVGKMLGVNQTAVSQWERGRTHPSHDMLKEVCKLYNESPDYFLGQDLSDVDNYKKSMPLPIFSALSVNMQQADEPGQQEFVEIPLRQALTGKYFAFRVGTKAMEPRFLQGDVVIVQREIPVESGDVVVVAQGKANAQLRRIIIQPDGVVFSPFNVAYESWFHANDSANPSPYIIFGRVVELRAAM